MEEKVNSSTKHIMIKDLRMANQKLMADLNRLSQEKEKTYRATIWSETDLSSKLKGALPSSKFKVEQRTPIRVLPSRTLMTRPKKVHILGHTVLEPHWFTLDIRTEAGTYIKEFVHGDRGRTHPSISSLLGCQAEITQLD